MTQAQSITLAQYWEYIKPGRIFSINRGLTGPIMWFFTLLCHVGVRFIESPSTGLDQSSPYEPKFIEKIQTNLL